MSRAASNGRASSTESTPTVAVFVARERARTLARKIFPRRHGRILATRSVSDYSASFKEHLIDVALVDLATSSDEAWQAATLAREYPSVPFLAILPGRGTDAVHMSRCVELEFADFLIEAVDEGVARELIEPLCFTTRFADSLQEPPASLHLSNELQLKTWRLAIARGGRAVRTDELARALGVSREHLSRRFAGNGAPNLKRVIDLIRLVAAAELAKNPGYDIQDLARVLGFASSSHLASTTQRVIGTRPSSLASLRPGDLFDRFARGRGRSR